LLNVLPPVTVRPPPGEPSRERSRAAAISLTVGTLLLLLKLGGWLLTGSTAIMSDALESVVNVVAAAFALYSIRVAQQPADDDHPYGHGKIEFLSAGFEGGLVAAAGVIIVVEAARRLWMGGTLFRLADGMALVGIAAAANLVLGFYLLRVGRRTHSLTLIADGKHVLSDVLTSVAALGALGAVLATGWAWIDPLAAGIAGANILRIGAGLVRDAVGGIMDEADPGDIEAVRVAIAQVTHGSVIRVGRVRTRHQGAMHHVDAVLEVDPRMALVDVEALRSRVETSVRDALGEAEVLCQIVPAETAPPLSSGM